MSQLAVSLKMRVINKGDKITVMVNILLSSSFANLFSRWDSIVRL